MHAENYEIFVRLDGNPCLILKDLFGDFFANAFMETINRFIHSVLDIPFYYDSGIPLPGQRQECTLLPDQTGDNAAQFDSACENSGRRPAGA